MPKPEVQPGDAEIRAFCTKLQGFRATLPEPEQEMFDFLVSAAAGRSEDEVQGFFFLDFLQQAMKPYQPKTKTYDFSADTIEGDLVKPEGTD